MKIDSIYSQGFHIGYKCFSNRSEVYISSHLKENDYKKVLESILHSEYDFSSSGNKGLIEKDKISYKIINKNTLNTEWKDAVYVKMKDVCMFVNGRTVLKNCNVYRNIKYNTYSDIFNEFAVVERMDGSKNFINLRTKKELNDKNYKECLNTKDKCMMDALCAIRMDDSITWIDTETGEEINDEKYMEIGEVYGNAAFVRKESGWNILYSSGFEALKKDYAEIRHRSRDVFTYACRCNDGLWTFCDGCGREVFDKYGDILNTYTWDFSNDGTFKRKAIYAAVTNDDGKSILLLDYKGNKVAIVGIVDGNILCNHINITNMDGKEYSLWADGTVTEGFTSDDNKDKHTIGKTFKPQYDKIENRFPEKYAKLY